MRSVVVEADGGSRGNPGPAAYGAVLRDAGSGQVLAEAAETIGRATNNVAEYRGLIAGLELVAAHAAGAIVEVRLDSKLVVEQMAGRWKVKHPDLRPLALQARRLAPPGTVWTWVPRLDNADADRLLNAVLDGERAEGSRVVDEVERAAAGEPAGEPAGDPVGAGAKVDLLAGWAEREAVVPTTVVLLRHGVTENTEARVFCGSGGADPRLTEGGRRQAERAAGWLARRAGQGQPVGLDGVGAVDVLVTSPLRRCRETAAVVGAELGLPVEVVDDLAEAAFGEWDGLSFAAVRERWPELLGQWLGDPTVSPPGGESEVEVGERVLRTLAGLVASHAGRTVLVVSHVTPIKTILRQALDTTAPVLLRMRLAPASLTVTQWWPDGVAVLRCFSYEPE